MRKDATFEQKYKYLLYRIQQALLEMRVDPMVHRGRRHLENGLWTCECTLDPTKRAVSHEEMTEIKNAILKDETYE